MPQHRYAKVLGGVGQGRLQVQPSRAAGRLSSGSKGSQVLIRGTWGSCGFIYLFILCGFIYVFMWLIKTPSAAVKLRVLGEVDSPRFRVGSM